MTILASSRSYLACTAATRALTYHQLQLAVKASLYLFSDGDLPSDCADIETVCVPWQA